MQTEYPMEAIGLLLSISPAKNRVVLTPHALKWKGERYPIEVMGMHHTRKDGEKRLHVFGFSCGNMDMTVELDPETLGCTLTEVNYENR